MNREKKVYRQRYSKQKEKSERVVRHGKKTKDKG
jgi:hypothetical protein